MKTTIEFSRRYSVFAPAYTYAVWDQGLWLGEVARNTGNRRCWWASNKTWHGGGDLERTFTTRYAAAMALRRISDGQATLADYERKTQ